ncbi:hypothetical protein [Mycobacterium sp. PSTR-4-N]|uniref:hypothetical protein n=1 Tax=Mycobacterium sp. PSTR-4-N TaxID=2917745 RepID=UPI001F151F1E|nr:hypothetical protein [Mycobacterium sp. PSTR-4-N]MCG7598116.1 hypothetical protein [Mycobacterium sp. PSTR-4-N]
MMTAFADAVEAIVGPVLAVRGFMLDQVDDESDSGGRDLHVVYYRSPDCRIQVYQSSREGETNAMIAPSNAPNQLGLNAPGWQFLTTFIEQPAGPIAEVIEKARLEYHAYGEPLLWVRDRIVKYFDAARARIAAPPGKD